MVGLITGIMPNFSLQTGRLAASAELLHCSKFLVIEVEVKSIQRYRRLSIEVQSQDPIPGHAGQKKKLSMPRYLLTITTLALLVFSITPDYSLSAESSQGTGFMIHPDGYIVTSAHVIGD